ncbi:hypothetical protein SDC9_141527 [bioreactor metagenome]|uniref:Uncharacterized protein n=1 Tax=bioreactor metagenome TaxID=1076179 RepID=A0A645DYI7_9ZZZZ
MLNKVFQSFICQLCFICPCNIIEAGEYTTKSFWIGTLNAIHSLNNYLSNILTSISQVNPMATFWNYKAMIFIKSCKFLITTGSFQCILGFFIVHVTDSLKEQDWCNVILKLILVDRASQNIASLIQMSK